MAKMRGRGGVGMELEKQRGAGTQRALCAILRGMTWKKQSRIRFQVGQLVAINQNK